MSLARSTVSCTAQGSRQVMSPVRQTNTDEPMFTSQTQKWQMTASRLYCDAITTGALVVCQIKSKISRLLKLPNNRLRRITHLQQEISVPDVN